VASALFVLAGLSACSKTETSASLITDAQQYVKKGDIKAALIQAKNAVANNPQDGEARLLLSHLYTETGDAVSAEKEIRKAMALGIGAERTAPILAKSLLMQGQAQKVLDTLTPALANTSSSLLAMRGDASLNLGNSAGAKQAYEQALALQPNAGDALVGLARYSMTQNDVAAAERYTADALAKDGSNANVWAFKAMLARSQAKPDDALAAYSEVLKLKPGHRTAHVEKAQIEIGQRKFDLARADLAAARKELGGDLNVTYTQALLDFSEGKYAPANNALQKILGLAPDHMPSVLLAGAVELKLGATQQAEAHLRKYLQANPENVYARKLLAQSLLYSAQPAEAVAVLAPALNGSSDDPQLMGLAGESYLKTKDFGKSTAYFQQATALAPKVAGLHTALGLSKLAQGDAATAVSELEKGASLESASADAGLTLVRTQLGLKHYDEALAAAIALEKQRPSDPQVQVLKGGVYSAKHDRVNARASFEKALALKADTFPASVYLAQMDMQDNKPQEAKRRFEVLLAKDKKHIGAMTALGEMAAMQGHAEEALGWFDKASSENPDALAPAMRLAKVQLRMNQPQKALAAVRKFQAANPTNADLLDVMGQAQLVTNDNAAALETYSKIVKLVPNSAMAHLRLSGAHIALNNDAAAAEDLKRALAIDPQLLLARLGQVQLAVRSKKPEEALAIARALQKQDATALAGYILEGDLQLSQNKPALALAPLEKGYAFRPTAQGLLKLAGAMRLAGKGKDIEPRLLQWQKAHPDDMLVAMYLAESSMAEKQNKVAIERFEAIVKQQPKNAVALNNLAWAYQQEKDPRAVATAEQALLAAPGNPSVMDTLGWILVEQGNTARALPLLQKAAALAPASREIHYHLAAALSKSGDKVNARKELDKLLADNKPFPQMDDAKALLKTL
jgi:putative PEP-CTERM system TPR-repeat lipoprotein